MAAAAAATKKIDDTVILSSNEGFNYESKVGTLYALSMCERNSSEISPTTVDTKTTLSSSDAKEYDTTVLAAVGSFIEAYENKIEIVQFINTTNPGDVLASLDHPYPPTKVAWQPASANPDTPLLASAGDYLRVWKVNSLNSDTTCMKFSTNAATNTSTCAPLTSCCWNKVHQNLVATSSVDTTVTIWDIDSSKSQSVPHTQLIAHDAEVLDVDFSPTACGKLFGSVGADGSVRVFDLRCLDSSTILYESSGSSPLVRLAWNPNDPNYVATIDECAGHSVTVVIDIRVPATALATLRGHDGGVNALSWAPDARSRLCTVGSDGAALVWDLGKSREKQYEPVLQYRAHDAINNMQWYSSKQIAMTVGNSIEIVNIIF